MKNNTAAIKWAAIGAAVGAALTLFVTLVLLPGPSSLQEYPVPAASGVTDELLTSAAVRSAGFIRSGDYESLAELVHPERGLLFSPYATVNTDTNRSFTPDEVADFSRNTEKYVWGVMSDGGEPISMTVSDYLDTYVRDLDYASAPLIGINYTVRTGNALENVSDVFPDSCFVDLCFPGESGDGNDDWSILRLVFQEYEGELKLTAVIHSEFTL